MVSTTTVLQRGLAALLLLGLYHVILQQFVSTDSVGSGGAARPCRSGKSSVRAPALTAPPIETQRELQAPTPWSPPAWSNLEANFPAALVLGAADPATTTLHFTFGSASMMQFFRNWLHFVKNVGIAPVVIGAADKQMYVQCTAESIAAIAIAPGLDVWNYTRTKKNESTVVQEGKSEWKYYRHHKSSFLEIGLVKAAFLWELLCLGYDVLISDLDIVWLSPVWLLPHRRPAHALSAHAATTCSLSLALVSLSLSLSVFVAPRVSR